MIPYSAQQAQMEKYAHEINLYVRDELKGQYVLLAGAHRANSGRLMARHGHKGRPTRGWSVLSIFG